jgi:glucose 1-dehydrogenase
MTALVTGASRGIGQGIALELAKAGAHVAVNYRSHPEEAEAVCHLCRQEGVKAIALQADMAVQEEAEALVDRAAEEFGDLDIVVSNAAYSDRELFYKADLEGFRRTIDVSMWGAFYLTRKAALRMIEQGEGGNLVVISSPHAHLAIPGAMAYNMAKAAIDQMARTAAVELAEHGIRVNIVHPGWTDTPGERKFFSQETLQTQAAGLPLGRLGEPNEIGRGVVFLCDPRNAYITGSTVTIDGGIQLPFREMYRTKENPEGAS